MLGLIMRRHSPHSKPRSGQVAEWHPPRDAPALPLQRSSGVGHAFAGHLQLEFARGRHDVERQTMGRRFTKVRIRHHAQLDAVPLEHVEQLAQVAHFSGQPVDAVDHDVVELTLLDFVKQPL